MKLKQRGRSYEFSNKAGFWKQFFLFKNNKFIFLFLFRRDTSNVLITAIENPLYGLSTNEAKVYSFKYFQLYNQNFLYYFSSVFFILFQLIPVHSVQFSIFYIYFIPFNSKKTNFIWLGIEVVLLVVFFPYFFL